MSAPNNDHPDRSELEAFSVGVLDAARSAAVEQHLAACESCCEAVQNAPDDTLLNQLREAVTRPPEPAPVEAGPSGLETVSHPSAAADAPVEGPADLMQHPRYRLLKLLGAGGMGAVYQAEHGVMRRLVALKVIKRQYTSNRAAAERFQREIRAAAQLHHPNIVVAYDAEQAGDTHFLVMEYIDGVSLARLIAERGPLPVAEACEYVRQAALGLQHAHERGMVHRDVKPHNLIRTADGVVKVLDFGLASASERGEGQLTGANVIMGTPDYIAPEQAEDTHHADARSDIYALGCTLYHLLTGRPPFTHPSTLLKLMAHRKETPPPVRAGRTDVSAELAALLDRMMAKAPADRCQTAAEVAASLAPLADAPALPGPRPRSRRRLWIAAAAAAVCMAGLAAAVAAVVVRVQTEQGEVTIQTDDPSIEVVVTKGGKLVRIVDPQSKKTWELDTANYTLGMADQPDGLTIALDGKAPFVLHRKGEKVVTITRAPAPVPADGSAAMASAPIQIVQRVGIPAGLQRLYQVAISPDGQLFAADLDYGAGVTIMVWDGWTGKEVQLFRGSGGWTPAFTSDGKRFLFIEGAGLAVYDTTTWNRVRTISLPNLDSYRPLPDGRCVLVWLRQPGKASLALIDLESGKTLHSWPVSDGLPYVDTPDGRVLLVKPLGEKSYCAWDVGENKPSGEFAAIGKYERIRAILPGNKQAVVKDGADDYLIVIVADGKRVGRLSELPYLLCTGGRAQLDIPFEPGRHWLEPVNGSRSQLDYRIALHGDTDGTLRLFDGTGKERASLRLPDGEKLPTFGSVILLSPDARHACVATGAAVYLLRLPDPPADKAADEP